MKSFISAMVVAASFALLVPDTQSLRAAESFRELPQAAHAAFSAPAESDSSDDASNGGGELTWLLALGFLAAIVSRRLGTEP
jgi:hypothetical protein